MGDEAHNEYLPSFMRHLSNSLQAVVRCDRAGGSGWRRARVFSPILRVERFVSMLPSVLVHCHLGQARSRYTVSQPEKGPHKPSCASDQRDRRQYRLRAVHTATRIDRAERISDEMPGCHSTPLALAVYGSSPP